MSNIHKDLVEKLKDWDYLEDIRADVTIMIYVYKRPVYIYSIGRSRCMNGGQRKN